MTPSVVKNGEVIIVISVANTLPQAMFYFANGHRYRLLFLIESRYIPRRPDLIETYIDNNVGQGDRAFVIQRKAVLKENHSRRGSQRCCKEIIN